MTGFLLDTNVVSELMKRRPNRGVIRWIEGTAEDLLHLSVITLGEVRKGIDLLAEDDPKRAALLNWLEDQVRSRFAGRLLSFDEGVADRWGQIEATTRKRRLNLPTIDAQLAATALHHNLTFVTRNVADVAAVSVPVFNPWSS
ncbi:MAG: type II toxin-antitoxin system VapC family toxin [Longimicrobiales bacterium]